MIFALLDLNDSRVSICAICPFITNTEVLVLMLLPSKTRAACRRMDPGSVS
jgi:hypothetical protein